jgi:hypothetical protein
LLDFISTLAAATQRPEIVAFIAAAQGAAKSASNSPLVVGEISVCHVCRVMLHLCVSEL